MPTPVVVGDVVRVVVANYFETGKQASLNRLHYVCTVSKGAQYESLAAAFWSNFVTVYRAWMPDSCRFQGVSVQKLLPGVRSGVFYHVDPKGGLSGTGILTSQVSGIIRYKTTGVEIAPPGPNEPGTHGRSYVGFPAQSNANFVTNGMQAIAVTRLRAIAARIGPRIVISGGSTWQLVIQRGVLSFPVETVDVIEQWATQRRRGAFGKLNKNFGT